MTAVSVIIPTFNRANVVGRAVSSVLFQSFQEIEILVVDDGSTDSTWKTIRQFGTRIQYLPLGSNFGVSAARNAGIRKSTAPFIAFLDSDDYWLPEKLAIQMDYFKQNQDIHVCQTEELWIRRGRRVNPKKKHRKPSGNIFSPSLKMCLVSPSAVMIKRAVLEEVGLFDEVLPACGAFDLWLRIAARYPFALIRKPLVVKTGGHADQLSRRFPAMDRFRIYALANLIHCKILTPSQELEAFMELQKKCRIYAKGCLKRGRKAEGRFYQELPEKLRKGPIRTWP